MCDNPNPREFFLFSGIFKKEKPCSSDTAKGKTSILLRRLKKIDNLKINLAYKPGSIAIIFTFLLKARDIILET